MNQDCAGNTDDELSVQGWRFDIERRVHEDDATVAFIDLLGTRRLYEESTLPTVEQAKKLFHDLVQRFDSKFCECFRSKEALPSFDISIFADSIAICVRKRTAGIVEQIVEFLLEYQIGLIVNRLSPSRAVVMRDSFFSFKIMRASEQSVLGSPYTSVSLCGGRAIKRAHDCLEGLPIGVYVTEQIIPDLTTEQQKRIVPVKHTNRYPDLSFVKARESIERYLPLQTANLLHTKPEARRTEITESIRAAFRDLDASAGPAAALGLRQPWDVLRPCVQGQDALDKWMPWIVAHLGKDNEIARSNKHL
jgi:hypothetical protein